MKTTLELPESVIVKHQKKIYTKLGVAEFGEKVDIVAKVRHDDSCGNGHNSFSITGTIYEAGKRGDMAYLSGGCIHDEIKKHFPELAPFIKWHLSSTDEPIHYVSNTLYHARDTDYNGYRKGEPCKWKKFVKFGRFPMLFTVDKPMLHYIESGPDWNSVEIEQHEHPQNGGTGYQYSANYRPTGYGEFCNSTSEDWYKCSHGNKRKLEQWIECFKKYNHKVVNEIDGYSEGSEPNLEAARSAAVWPDATLEQLCDKEALQARLPQLMQDFKTDVEALGLVY